MICWLKASKPRGRGPVLADWMICVCARTCLVQRGEGGLQRGQQRVQPIRHCEFGPVAHAIPWAFEPVAILQRDAASALREHFEVAIEALADAGLRAGAFLFHRGHAHEGQRVRIAGQETVQGLNIASASVRSVFTRLCWSSQLRGRMT